MRRLLIAPFVIAFITPGAAQDLEFFRALEAAQRQRPAHFTLFAADGGRYHAGELLFEGDPALNPQQKSQAAQDRIFSEIRPVRRDGAGEQVDVNLKVDPRARC